MRPLSASDSISPAFERTRLILFTPFRFGRSWKLSATAYICRIGTLFMPFPLVYLGFLPAMQRRFGAAGGIALVVGLLLFTALFVYIFHLCSRLQFAHLDIVVNRDQFVRPAWRKYRSRSLRWTGVKLAAGTALTLACALPIAVYIRRLIPMFLDLQHITPGQQPPPQLFLGFFAAYAMLLLIFGSAYLVSSLLGDFIVPSLALEDTSIGEALRRMGVLIRTEPGQFALYTLLKVVLGLALYFAALVAWEIAFILVSLILVLVCALIGFLLHLIGIPAAILSALMIVGFIVWYAAALYSMAFPVGAVFTFLDAYGLYFLGGRYPMLGDLLDRSTPIPALYAGAYPPPPAGYGFPPP